MTVGLVDMDKTRFPNLALMKISAYHKAIGDDVEWVNYLSTYDQVYKSKVFTFTKDVDIINSGSILKGGTGYSIGSELPTEIDGCYPDYSIYGIFDTAYGFLTRGCPNKCEWCVVPLKEGNIKPYDTIENITRGRKLAVLMDNNVLASDHGLRQIEKIIEFGIRVDFNQGLDARLIAKNEDIAKLLARVKWIKLRMACDTVSQMPYVERATELLRKFGAKPVDYFVYVLVKDIPDALERVEFLRKLKLNPFAQPYLDFKTGKTTKELKRFARWVNHKAIFKTIKWENYDSKGNG